MNPENTTISLKKDSILNNSGIYKNLNEVNSDSW